MKKQTFLDSLLLFAVFFPIYLAFSGSSYLWDWDETVYAAAAMQMHERGDYIVPIVTYRMDGSPFYGDKPILMYWGMLASFALFGVSELSARLPSAFFGTLSLILVYLLSKRMFNRPTGLLSACALGTMFLYCVESSAVTPDATLMFWTTAATLFYILGVFPENESETGENEDNEQSAKRPENARSLPKTFFPTSWKSYVPMYLCLGFGFLDKGPVGVVLPMAVIGMFMLIKRLRPLPVDYFVSKPGIFPALLRLLRPFHPVHFLKTVWAMRPITAVILIAIIAVPWYWLVDRETDGAWTKLFFGVHNFGRAAAAMEGHGYPFDFLWYYPFSLLAITFPWSIFFVGALLNMIRRLRQGTPRADGYIFASCWVCAYIGVFSIVETKMPNYIFLASTGAAILYASYLYEWSQNRALIAQGWMIAALAVFLFVGIVLGLVLWFFLIPVFTPRGQILMLIPLIMVFAAIRLFMVLRLSKRPTFLFGMVAASIAITFSIFYLGARVVSRQQNYAVMFAEIKKQSPNPVVCCFDQFEPSWVFYGKKPIVRYNATPEGIDGLRHFLDKYSGNAFIITARDKYEKHLENQFQDEITPVIQIPYFLKLEKVPKSGEYPFGLRQRELLLIKKNI